MKVKVILDDKDEGINLMLPTYDIEYIKELNDKDIALIDVKYEDKFDEVIFDYVKNENLYSLNKLISIYNQLSQTEISKLMYLIIIDEIKDYKDLAKSFFILDDIEIDENIKNNKDLVLNRGDEFLLDDVEDKSEEFIEELAEMIKNKEKGAILDDGYFYMNLKR